LSKGRYERSTAKHQVRPEILDFGKGNGAMSHGTQLAKPKEFTMADGAGGGNFDPKKTMARASPSGKGPSNLARKKKAEPGGAMVARRLDALKDARSNSSTTNDEMLAQPSGRGVRKSKEEMGLFVKSKRQVKGNQPAPDSGGGGRREKTVLCRLGKASRKGSRSL